MAIIKERNKAKKTVVNAIPQELIYETLADGTPVYYHGYKDCLDGTKTAEALIEISFLQGIIISIILEYLYKTVPSNYRLMN